MRKTNVCIMVLYMLLIFMLTGCTGESKEQVVPAESRR